MRELMPPRDMYVVCDKPFVSDAVRLCYHPGLRCMWCDGLSKEYFSLTT